MKKAVVISSICITIIMITSIFMHLKFHNPNYTLINIHNSLIEHDWNKFKKFVDIESFSANSFQSPIEGSLINNQLKSLVEGINGNTHFLYEIFGDTIKSILPNSLNDEGKILKGKIAYNRFWDTIEVEITFRDEYLFYKLISIDLEKLTEPISPGKLDNILHESNSINNNVTDTTFEYTDEISAISNIINTDGERFIKVGILFQVDKKFDIQNEYNLNKAGIKNILIAKISSMDLLQLTDYAAKDEIKNYLKSKINEKYPTFIFQDIVFLSYIIQ